MFYLRKMSVCVSAMATLLFVLTLSGCGKEETTQKDKERPQGALVMGTSADLPPFEFFRTGASSPEIVGLDIDIAKAIGQALNIDIQVKDMDFASLIAALQAGRVDFVMAAMTPTTERQQSVDFSTLYLRLPTALVTKKDSTIKTMKDLHGLKVGVQLGSSHEEVLKKMQAKDPSIQSVSLNKLGELIQELLAGRIAAIIMESKSGEAFALNNVDLHVSIIPDFDLTFAIAFAKGSPWRDRFNEVIDHLKKSGQIEKFKTKWLATKTEQQ